MSLERRGATPLAASFTPPILSASAATRPWTRGTAPARIGHGITQPRVFVVPRSAASNPPQHAAVGGGGGEGEGVDLTGREGWHTHRLPPLPGGHRGVVHPLPAQPVLAARVPPAGAPDDATSSAAAGSAGGTWAWVPAPEARSAYAPSPMPVRACPPAHGALSLVPSAELRAPPPPPPPSEPPPPQRADEALSGAPPASRRGSMPFAIDASDVPAELRHKLAGLAPSPQADARAFEHLPPSASARASFGAGAQGAAEGKVYWALVLVCDRFLADKQARAQEAAHAAEQRRHEARAAKAARASAGSADGGSERLGSTLQRARSALPPDVREMDLGAMMGDDMLRSPRWRELVRLLRRARLHTQLVKSANSEREFFLVVGATFDRLEEVAEAKEFELRYRPMATLENATGFSTASTLLESSFGLYKRGRAARFARTRLNGGESVFTSLLACRLVEAAVTDALLEGSRWGKTLAQLVNMSNALTDSFWLHDDAERAVLAEDLGFDHARQRLDCSDPGRGFSRIDELALERCRSYFGEAVAFYFAWLNFYTRSLTLPALIGILVFPVYWLRPALYYEWLILLYAGTMMVWSAAFLEKWKAREALLRRQWNMENFAEVEEERRGFRGDDDDGFYTPEGLWVAVHDADLAPLRAHGMQIEPPRQKRASRLAKRAKVVISLLVLGVMAAGCILTTLGILWFRVRVEDLEYGGVRIGSYTAAFINALAISTFNGLFRAIALRLNDWENHRRSSEFLKALVYKMSVFQFINCYSTLFYIAFVKPLHVRVLFLDARDCLGTEAADSGLSGVDERYANCYEELRTQLLMIMLLNLVLGTAQELLQGRQNRLRDRLRERVADLAAAVSSALERARERRAARRAGRPVRARRSSFERWVRRGKVLVPPPVDGGGRQARGSPAAARRRGSSGSTPPSSAQQQQQPSPAIALARAVETQEDTALTTSEAHGLGATFYEYNEMVLQFGYLAMFAVAFPPASMLALGNNVLEARTDWYKLLYDSKRVKWEGATGIAPWDTILRAIEIVGVLTNIAVYWLVSPDLRRLNWVVQLIIAGSSAMVIYIVKAIIGALVPDVPDSVKIAVAKERWRVDQKIKWEERKMKEAAGGTDGTHTPSDDSDDSGSDDASEPAAAAEASPTR